MGAGELSIFERISIQMEHAVPLIRDLQRLLGEKAVNEALAERLRADLEDAKRTPVPPADLGALSAGLEQYAAGDALDYDVVASDAERFDFNVTGCRYAALMERLGARDLGPMLICNLDFAMAERGGMTLERTQTCMQGADFCDFRYRKRGGA